MSKRYVVLAAQAWEESAKAMEKAHPDRFTFFPTKWAKFDDSEMDDIEVGGFTPINHIKNSSIIFFASFHSNDAILSQLHVLITLLESFIQDLTIILPFFPMGTMERVTKEGQVATANTIARLFSNLPPCGFPTRVMIYDIHTLQNRFYLYGHALASLHTTIPLLITHIGQKGDQIDAIAFPDDGAHKRFKEQFQANGFPLVVCAKVRDGNTRRVKIQEGEVTGLRVLVVDDLVRSGGTMVECAKALQAAGASSISAFCAHAGFKEASWRRFTEGGDRADVFDRFLITNSVPTVTRDLQGLAPFEVIDLLPAIIEDL